MFQKKLIYLFVFDGFADWEAAYATAEISKSKKYQVVTFALENKPIISMGGLRILPDITAGQIEYCNTELLILPGGYMWELEPAGEIIPVVKQCHKNNIPVAAICGATLFLANAGYLDNTPHTSNQLKYLTTYSSTYCGERYYQDKPCVNSNSFITANGAASLEFAYEILNTLKVYNKDELDQWYKVFKHGIQHWIIPEKQIDNIR
ncbi:MAG: yoaZ [Firmicutes bacterium]|nr:yoaZ [Bacillota bacterium]